MAVAEYPLRPSGKVSHRPICSSWRPQHIGSTGIELRLHQMRIR